MTDERPSGVFDPDRIVRKLDRDNLRRLAEALTELHANLAAPDAEDGRSLRR